ncbi:DUF1669 domain-containing protein [Candidatus Dependentiae bacterium]|nr:DUF1669 domain-containing protein [Candidatus Dependentiae bacterium]
MRVKHLFLIYFFILSSFISVFCDTQVFFSPEDKVSEKLIKIINNAKRNIYVAVYMITDKRIAQALVDAKLKKDLDVQIITDQSCLEYKYGKINFLKEGNIDVFVFKNNLKRKKRAPKIMHNKFAIIDNFVWTGSFNWTVQANSKNKENVILIDDTNIYEKYLKQFNCLKKKCIKQAMNLMLEKKKTKSERIKEGAQNLKSKLFDFLKDVRKKFNSK